MARIEVNRSREMEVFVRIVEQSGFSAAARSLRMTPSAVSKLVARLEARLGARLVNRSTRKLQLTAEGGEIGGAAGRSESFEIFGRGDQRHPARAQFARDQP